MARCAAIKAATVAEDERDRGARMFLNYGHTLGHALERLGDFAGAAHGEAIAVGMVFAARLGERTGRSPEGLTGRTVRLLHALGLDPDATLPPARAILDALRMDKKFHAGIRFVLLEDVGRPVVVGDVAEEAVRSWPRWEHPEDARALRLRPEPRGARPPRPGGLRPGDARPTIMDEVTARGVELGHEVDWLQSDHEGTLVETLLAAAGEGVDGRRAERRGPHALLLRGARRRRGVRRPRPRGAHVQRQRP